MQVFNAGGVHIHYRDEGPEKALQEALEVGLKGALKGALKKPPTIVLINSLGTDLRSWDTVTNKLTQHFRCIRYDKRGHGLSSAPEAPYSIGDHADDLAALLNALQVDAAILCGLSVGGMIAMKFAQRHPDRVTALVLADTAHKIGTVEMWQARINTIAAGGLESVAEPILQRWFTRAYREQQQPALAAWRNMLCRTPVAGYLGTCAAIRDADLTHVASEIAAPTLCLCGDEDGATPPALVQSLAELIPGAKFKIIEGAGHIPCVEQPQQFVELLHSFFEENNLEEKYLEKNRLEGNRFERKHLA